MSRTIIAGPGGNYTAFVFDAAGAGRARIDRDLRMRFPFVEQTCFAFRDLGIWHGEMAGGEFCGSAALGFSYLVSTFERDMRPCFRFSGCREMLEADVSGNHVSAQFFCVNPSQAVVVLETGMTLVNLPGISHFVMDGNLPCPDPQNYLRRLALENGLDAAPAVGLIRRIRRERGVEIDPWVWVPGAGSLMRETACISGSVATSLILRGQGMQGIYEIGQPCGQPCRIEFREQAGGELAVIVSSQIDIRNTDGFAVQKRAAM